MTKRLEHRWAWHLRVSNALQEVGARLRLPDPTKPVTCGQINSLELALYQALGCPRKLWQLDYTDWDFCDRPSQQMRDDPRKQVAVGAFDRAYKLNGVVEPWRPQLVPINPMGGVTDLFS